MFFYFNVFSVNSSKFPVMQIIKNNQSKHKITLTTMIIFSQVKIKSFQKAHLL